jgi:hypothetical protein
MYASFYIHHDLFHTKFDIAYAIGLMLFFEKTVNCDQSGIA